MARRRKSKCLLLYVYSYALGLGVITISVVLTWTEASPLSTRALLAVSIGLSLGVLVAQIFITRALAQTRTWVIARSVIIVAGLFLSAVLTSVALCLYREAKAMSLFLVCGLFSIGLHLTASVAQVVHMRERRDNFTRQGNAADAEDRNGQELDDTSLAIVPVSAFVDETLMVNPSLTTSPWQHDGSWDANGPDRPCPDVCAARGELQLSLRQLLMLAVPANVVLPTYADIFDTKPPEYSEVMAGLSSPGSSLPDPFYRQQEGNGSMSAVTEDPPNYDDICSDTFISHVFLDERNDILSNLRTDILSNQRTDILSNQRTDILPNEMSDLCSDERNATCLDERNTACSDERNATCSDERNTACSDERNATCSAERNATCSDERSALSSDGRNDERNATCSDERNATHSDETNDICLDERNETR